MFPYQRKQFKQINVFFESKKQVPKQAYTMGIGTIMSARKILIIISGEDKAEAVKKIVWRGDIATCAGINTSITS